jgi:MSHA biogenesis protein MshM
VGSGLSQSGTRLRAPPFPREDSGKEISLDSGQSGGQLPVVHGLHYRRGGKVTAALRISVEFAMEAVLDYYSLNRHPFAERRRGGPVLATQALQRAIERIRTDLAVGATRICVTGPPGVGKTSLARVLPQALRKSAGVAGAARIADPTRDWQQIRSSITRQLALPGGELSAANLKAVCSRGRRLVLIVDAAEQLGDENLDHLESLLEYRAESGEPCFQCVLLAEVGLEPAGGALPLHSWLDPLKTLQVLLEPLSSQDTYGYIQQRLIHAGWRGARLFTTAAAMEIHRETGGIPRAVGELCSRVLERSGGRRFTELGAEFVEEVLHGELASARDPRPELPEVWTPAPEAALVEGRGTQGPRPSASWRSWLGGAVFLGGLLGLMLATADLIAPIP